MPAAIGLAAALFLAAPAARAADVRLATGPTAAGTAWRGDAAFWGESRLAVRFAGVAGPYAGLSVGYATVDKRVLTLLTLGAQAWLPVGPVALHARVGFAHQHEEDARAVADNVGKALLGIGDAIRHRGGLDAALGLTVPVARLGRWSFHAGAEATLRWFPDDLGPRIYAGGGLRLGAAFDL